MMMGFQRRSLSENRGKPKRRSSSTKVKKDSEKPKVKLDMDRQIAYAICALRYTSLRSHHIQVDVTNWISENYGFVTPETVQRVFRRMTNDPEHIIRKVPEGKFVRYEIVKLFDLRFDGNQLGLF